MSPEKKVLIADDSPVVLNALESMFGAAGFAVVRARDGLEALEKAYSEKVSLAALHAFLAQAANQAHIVVENSRLVERLRDLAIRDSLTELYNHRHALDLLNNEFERVGRYAEGVSLLMLDLDEFKRVNDVHGHPAGDAVLKEIARVLKETLRTVDSVGRYGGEEFVIILPHTSPEEAKATGERIRRKVASHVFWVGAKPLNVTVSVGVASYPTPTVDSSESLLREADAALYRAKEAGRNRVE